MWKVSSAQIPFRGGQPGIARDSLSSRQMDTAQALRPLPLACYTSSLAVKRSIPTREASRAIPTAQRHDQRGSMRRTVERTGARAMTDQSSPHTPPFPPTTESANATGRTERRSDDPIVRAAIDNVRRHLAALSASEIVQLVLYPEPLVAWAKGAGVDDSQVANLFRRHRRYNRLRTLLATRLGVPITVLDHLIDAQPAVPAAKRPAAYRAILADAGLGTWAERPPIDWTTPPYPPHRDGTNPLERLAMAVLGDAAPTMPPSRIIGYAMWPETLAAFAARAQRFSLDQLLTTLSGLRRSDAIEVALARRLRIPHRTLDAFIRAGKRDAYASDGSADL